MKISIATICILLYYLCLKNEVSADFAIAGYLPDYRIHSYLDQQLSYLYNDENYNDNINNNIPSLITSSSTSPLTDVIMFSLQPHSKGFFGCCLQNDHYDLMEKFVNGTGKVNFNTNGTLPESVLSIWITVGGAGRSDKFVEISSNKELRNRLIRSILNLAAKYSFIKGIDFDVFNPRNVQERDNYVQFLKEAVYHLRKKGLKVSITLHPHHARLIPTTVYRLIDRVHLMTYDMIDNKHGSTSSSNYHADINKVQTVVKIVLELGIVSKKLLIGIPAYSRHFRDPSRVKTFGEIYDDIQSSSSRNSNSNDINLLREVNSWEGYEFESSARIQAKISFAKENNLGGVFFWELGQDKFTDKNPYGVMVSSSIHVSKGKPTTVEDDKMAEL